MNRLGLIYPTSTPLSSRSWSGTPAGLARGFEQLGIEVVPIGASFSFPGRAYRAIASRAGRFGGAVADRRRWVRSYRSRVMSGVLREAGHLDAVLAMGTDMYDLASVVPERLRRYTYDDATLAQMWEHPQSDVRLSGFSARDVEAWIQQQRASTLSADLNFASTSWAATSIEGDYGSDPCRIEVVGMGHRPKSVAGIERDWSSPRYLFVGLDWERKNGARVLQAFARVRQSHPEARLDIVGINRSVTQVGVHSHGVLARDDSSAQEQLARLYNAATCFVLPSRLDPSPISYLEAASAGLPVIATTQGGAQELLGDGAIAVDPENADQIAAAMLLATDPKTAQLMGNAGASAAARSTWAGVAGRMLEHMRYCSLQTPLRSRS